MAQDNSLTVAVQACIANADELLRGARTLAAAGLQRLAYHLGVLALEEVGKSSILEMQVVAKRAGREVPTSIVKGLDDHVRKLFWAVWGPSMGMELITKEQIDAHTGLAQRLHDRRMLGLYVDSHDGGLSIPMDAISQEETVTLLRFVTSCIEIARVSRGDGLVDDTAVSERQQWFSDVTDDPERRRLVMGAKSMARLKELGNVPEWVSWLKKTFEESEAEARGALERELQRQPDGGEAPKTKWRTTIRLYTPSHSIRQKPLNDMNKGLLWTQFRAVSGKNNQLLIDLHATGDLTLDPLYKTGLAISRRLVMALNVATLGFFWFHELLDVDPKQSGRFYEHITDVEANREVRIHRNPPLRLEFGSSRRVLESPDLNRWALCFGRFLHYDLPTELAICERYLDGLGLIAKSDVHMAFEVQAVVAFYLALKDAMKLYGPWVDEPFGIAMKQFAAEALHTVDYPHVDRLIEVGESINSGKGVPHAMTMNDVGVMKTLCDVYLIRTFQRLGPK